MSTSTIAPQIAQFARAVRDALSDLPDEERDELTEGLEADLTEAYAEDLANTLPDPVEYATELRTAAGLPMPADERTSWSRGIADAWASTRRDLASAIRRNPAAVHLIDFLDAVRPVWWIVRAWVVTWLLSAFFGSEAGFWPSTPFWFVVLVSLAVLSVQWGRGHWRFGALPPLLVVGNVAVAVLILPVIAGASEYGGYYDDGAYEQGYNDAMTEVDQTVQGLSFAGQPLENVYPYDADGKPLKNVQLFDVDGHPLTITPSDPDETGMAQRFAKLETGAEARNVFPLVIDWFAWDEQDNLTPSEADADPAKVKAYREGPFVKVPAVDTPKADKKVSANND